MMRVAISRAMLLCGGLALLLAALLIALAEPVGAAPALLVTETPTNEPPTRTATPAPATNTPVAPTDTAAPTSTPIPPTDVPDNGGGGGDHSSPTSTPTPTATVIPQIADPAITKSASIGNAQVGDTVEFTITVTNLGNATASQVVAEDTLPSFLALDGVSATRGDVSVNGTTVRVVIGDLAPGEVVTISVTARVVSSAAPPNNINTATVGSSSDTDNPDNNSSSVALQIAEPTPTAAPPASLPNTGDPGSPMLPALIFLGLALIAVSLFTRRRQA